VLTPSQDQRVRYEARLRTDHDRAEQVQAFLHSRPQVASDLPPNSSISGVIRLPDAPVGHHQAVPAAHAVKVSAMSVPILEESDLAPPRFVLPDFVDTSDARAGTRIKQYRLLGRIGAGGMGVVYLADSANDPERPVALKVCTGRDEEAHGRFKREILANSFISHPGIIDVYDAGVTDQGEDFLAMEFFDGEDMQEILDNDTKLEPSRAVDLCRQVFATLGAAHDAGVVHRDVKPENILVSRDGKTAKLMDFGIAIIRDLGEFEHMVFKTVEGGATGTPQFMSPEQAAGDKLTHSSDLYSMANVLYLALCGRLPFESESSSGFMACHMLEEPLPLAKADPGTRSLPKELHELLASLLDKNPANRPRSAAVVIEILERILPQIGKASSGRLFGFLWRGRGG
jgi:serine/threonine-protein kinase